MDYRKHYEKYLSVYEDIAVANGGNTVWIPTDDHNGWYVTDRVTDQDSEAWDRGYPVSSRPRILPRDLSADVERSAYTTISYANEEDYKTAHYRETDDGIEWMDGNSQRLPSYGDLVAWAIFVDIDIDKKYKERPLIDKHKDVVESRLKLWINAFSEMAGGLEHVSVLDSGGGMYVFVQPTALSPIADKYDPEDRQLIFDHIGKRVRSIVGKLDDLICEQDNKPQALFSADKVQNKSRQFKTIGSIHKDLDAVVHPVDPTDANVQHKTVDDITENDIKRAKEWAQSFTSEEHKSCIDSVIKYLFQGNFTERDDMDIQYVEGDSWEDIIGNWLGEKKQEIQAWEQAQERRKDISNDKLKKDVTQDKDVAREAVRRVNNQKLKSYIIEYLGSSYVYEKNGEEMDFFPFWRSESTESGRSAFYDYYEGSARFTDKADGTSRNIVYWVALEMTYDNENYPEADIIRSPGDDLDPADYSKCIKELRDRGEDIPILVPDVESEEQLSEWRMIDIGKELSIASEDDIIEKDNGKKTLVPQKWNDLLDRLEYEEITHNRSRKSPIKTQDINIYEDVEESKTKTEDDRKSEFYNKMGHYRPEFDSIEEYEAFLDSLPDYVVPFEYDGEISGVEPDGVVAGVFVEQDKESLSMSRYEPLPVQSVETIDHYTDLTIELTEVISKKQMRIFKKQNDNKS